MRVAALMKHTPNPVKDAMRAAGSNIGTNYEKAKMEVPGGPAPMDVGAISHGEKGRKESPARATRE